METDLMEARNLKEHPSGRKHVRIAAVLVLAALIATALCLRQAGYISPEGVMGFLGEHRTLAPLIYILIFAILPSLLITALPMTIGAGFLWGPVWGSVLSLTGSIIGHSVSFLVSRYVAGEYFKTRFDFALVKWLMGHVDRNGWKVVAFTRINPIFPASIVSYLFGLTSIKYIDYLWATAVFFIPPTIAIVSFGSSLGEFVLTGDIKGIVTGLVIASVALLVMFAMRPIARKLMPDKERNDI
jgi:uncharacterized membrane protein YdjX (TVP38/TMEM64 family)